MTITDEKLREAVELIKEYCADAGHYAEAANVIEAAITELGALRAAQTLQPIETLLEAAK